MAFFMPPEVMLSLLNTIMIALILRRGIDNQCYCKLYEFLFFIIIIFEFGDNTEKANLLCG